MLAAWLHAWGMIEVTSMGTPLPFPLMAVTGPEKSTGTRGSALLSIPGGRLLCSALSYD